MPTFSLKVNGQLHTVDVDPETPLLYVLSDELHLRGPKFGCGLAQCGACTVLVQGKVTRSCVMPVSGVREREIITLEGLGTPEKPHAIQQAFIDEGAAQCGFCLSGVILTAKVLLDEHPAASDEQIEEAFSSVLCRCFTHARMVRAIKRCCAKSQGTSEGQSEGEASA
jgi:nicotinate dehydrogenase subunit A